MEKTYYYGVVYLKNGDACIGYPCASEEEVRSELERVVARQITERNPPVATTYITRKVEARDGEEPKPLSLMEILGHPRSRDVLQSKKFIASITK